ncbi:hypothetical protein LW135_07365, partial [Helicobacter sp. faydin-H20]|uniref:hypothetical protein n=1 Tax=Helicobacter anatolicus TaxID=2905874 RepID=UPI001E533902
MKQIKTNKNFFNPIIASSLALVLNTSFAQAQCADSKSSQTPIICAGTKDSETKKDGLLTWNATGAPSQAYIPMYNNGPDNVITKLIFKFDSSGTDLQKDGSLGATSTLKAGSDINSIILKGNGKGIQMAAAGNGTLVANFNNQSNKTFTLDLSDAPDGVASFLGNIEIVNQGNKDNNSNVFTATFNHDFQGKIFIKDAAGNNTIKLTNGNLRGDITTQQTNSTSENKLTIDFTNNDIQKQANTTGRIIGNIYTAQNDKNNTTITIKGGGLMGDIKLGGSNNGSPDTGTLTVNFENGAVMKGNIGNSKNPSEANDFQKKVITFEDATTQRDGSDNFVLEGNITSYGTGPVNDIDKSNGNHVTFKMGSMQGNIRAEVGSGGRGAYNKVNFSGMNQSLSGISGNKGTITSLGGINEISFTGMGTRTVKADIISNAYIFAVDAQSYNQITFGNSDSDSDSEMDVTNILEGDIKAVSGYAPLGNKVTFYNGNSTITGNIMTTGGSNSIIFGSNDAKAKATSTNTITGNITANGGTNKISMNGTNTIAGTITAGPNGNQGINYFYFSGDKTTISKATDAKASDISIIAHNRD